jgi:hypothetical protein
MRAFGHCGLYARALSRVQGIQRFGATRLGFHGFEFNF